MKKMMIAIIVTLLVAANVVASNPVSVNAEQEVAELTSNGGFTMTLEKASGTCLSIYVYNENGKKMAEVTDLGTVDGSNYEVMLLPDVTSIRQTEEGVRIIWGPEPISPMTIIGAKIVEVFPE